MEHLITKLPHLETDGGIDESEVDELTKWSTTAVEAPF